MSKAEELIERQMQVHVAEARPAKIERMSERIFEARVKMENDLPIVIKGDKEFGSDYKKALDIIRRLETKVVNRYGF